MVASGGAGGGNRGREERLETRCSLRTEQIALVYGLEEGYEVPMFLA